jgi:hypothetical protein
LEAVVGARILADAGNDVFRHGCFFVHAGGLPLYLFAQDTGVPKAFCDQ